MVSVILSLSRCAGDHQAGRDRRAVRRQVLLPRRACNQAARHGASCPVAIAVSCSADRQALGKITSEGIFLEQLETDPAKYLPDTTTTELDDDVVRVDLSRPMSEIRAELSRYPIKTRLSLTGPLVVARDIAHAKIAERLAAGEPMPSYLRDHAVYYAGRPRHLRATLPGRSGRRRPGGWIATSRSSRPRAGHWSCWPRETGPRR